MTKKLNHTKIAECIKKLSICDDGKKGVTDLLKEFGYNPPTAPKPRMPKVGEVWYDDTEGSYVVTYVDKKKSYIGIALLGKEDTSELLWPDDFEGDKFLAKSPNEYFGLK